MKDLEKVSGAQLFSFWKNISVGMLVMLLTLLFSKLFPFYFSPIIGLLAGAFLYTMLYNDKLKREASCMIVPYAMFYCIIAYSFISILLNVLDIWNIVKMPKELSFFNEPYMPALILDPVCFVVLLIIYLRRKHLALCIDCKLSRGLSIERGKLGEILDSESHLQIRNLIWTFGILSIVVWTYFFIWYYQRANVNSRDWYIFTWLNIIAIFLDELYFASRYYNIYLDLKENGEIITEEELSDMTTKTYLRFYVICGNMMFVNTHVADPYVKNRFYTDTPFVTKRNVNGITTSEVDSIIKRMTGIREGELRFFYGRKSLDIAKHRLLRYFYFLDGKPEDYEDLGVDGEWISFETLKYVYNRQPKSMSKTFLTDLSRMITIVLTQKIFDERGYRKIKVKSYRPGFDLTEVREKHYDFQDDKWLRISMYNSDLRSFHFRKWLERLRVNRTQASLSKKKSQW